MPTAGFDGERHARRLAPAGGLLVAAGILVAGLPGALLALVGGCLLLLACVSARDGLLLVGPFARAELVAAARRGRPWLWRTLYVLAASAALALFVREAFRSYGRGHRGAVSAAAEQFFFTFAAAQFAYLTYLAGVLVAPVAAEEREKRRWEMLLTTDLRNREILLGKIVGRLATLFEPLLACLPVLAVLPFLGGVSPTAVGCAAVVTLFGVMGTAAVAAFVSTHESTAEKARNAMRGLLWAYYGLAAGLLAVSAFPPAWTFPAPVGLASPVEVRHLIAWLNAGNPLGAGVLYSMGVGRTGDVEADIVAATRRFAGFWAGATALFGLTAVAKLRARRFAGPPAAGSPGKARVWVRRVPDRPRVGDWPVAWWERWGRLGPVGARVARRMTPWWYARLSALFVVGLVGCAYQDDIFPVWWLHARRVAEVVFPSFVGIAALVAALVPMFNAAAGIARERAADTLDGLRLTALTDRDLVQGKLCGALLSGVPAYGLTLAGCLAGVVTGFMPWQGVLACLLVVPPAALSWAGFAVSFSARAATPAKAGRNLSVVFFGGGYLSLAVGAAALSGLGLKLQGTGSAVAVGAVLVVLNGLLGWAGYELAVRRLERDRG